MKIETYIIHTMGNKKIFIGIFLILTIYTNKAIGQNIKLEEVFVDCVERTNNGIVHYELYRISFIFRAINETSHSLAIGAYNAPIRDVFAKFGYFEFQTDSGEKSRLYSINRLRCVPPNGTISITADLNEGNRDFDLNYLNKFKSNSELINSIMNSCFSYTCVEEDYDSDVCPIRFHTQEITTNEYLIIFSSEGKAIESYYVEGYSFIKLRND